MPHTLASGGGNFLIPNMTFVVELVAFLIVLGVLWRYVVPPVQKAMKARQEMARELVSDSEQAKQLLEQARIAYEEGVTDGRREAARLRANAEERRREIVAGASAEAEEKAAEIIARGRAELKAEQEQATRQLRAELGALAVDLAEKIVGEALTDDQLQGRLIDRFLDEIEGQTAGGASADAPA